MKKISFQLYENSPRPVVVIGNGMTALLDTGAQIPVWTAPEQNIRMLNATKIKENVPFGGFGGTAYGTLYKLNDFRLGELLYPSLPIIASRLVDEPYFHIILSATMFSELIYEIDDSNHFLNVTIPDGQSLSRKLLIEDKNGRLHILTGEIK